jgi:hypothetical protein
VWSVIYRQKMLLNNFVMNYIDNNVYVNGAVCCHCFVCVDRKEIQVEYWDILAQMEKQPGDELKEESLLDEDDKSDGDAGSQRSGTEAQSASHESRAFEDDDDVSYS